MNFIVERTGNETVLVTTDLDADLIIVRAHGFIVDEHDSLSRVLQSLFLSTYFTLFLLLGLKRIGKN
jgi:hypothetical protein